MGEGYACSIGGKGGRGVTPQPAQRTKEHIEPIIWLLAFMVCFFAMLVIGISKWSPSDGQTFQVVSGMATTILGIFANRIMPNMLAGKKPDPPPGSTTIADVHQVTQTPPDPPPLPKDATP